MATKRAVKKKAAAKATRKTAAAKKVRAKKKAPAKKAAAKRSPAKPSPAKPSPAKTKRSRKLPAAWLKKQRTSLEEERETYLRQSVSLKAEADALAADLGGDTDFDEEGGEGATNAVERERDLVLSAKAVEEIESIDAAIGRLGAGTYGICLGCAANIPKARLEALPQAALCINCKTGGFRRR